MAATPTGLSPILREALIHDALVNCYKTTNNSNTLKVTSWDFKLCSTAGENFCSDVFVVNTKYELDGNGGEKSFIVKIMKPEIAEMGSSEQQMFETVLPGLEDCLFVGSDNKLHARCFLSERSEKEEFYVLENLNTLGYFSGDRVRGLDADHGLVLMQKIAKFHAASMMYVRKFPETVDMLEDSHFAEGASDYIAQSITFGGLKYVADMIENWPGYEHLAPRVRSVITTFNDRVRQVVDPKNATFNVISHGDLWVNNILFKCDEKSGKPIDVLFVDFQNCSWGGCGFDLNWFLNTSLELNVLKLKRKELLQAYYAALKTSLEINGFPKDRIPSWEDVRTEVKRCELIGLYTALCELPIVCLAKTESKDFTVETYGQPEKMSKMREVMYASERVKEHLLYALKYFEEIEIL